MIAIATGTPRPRTKPCGVCERNTALRRSRFLFIFVEVAEYIARTTVTSNAAVGEVSQYLVNARANKNPKIEISNFAFDITLTVAAPGTDSLSSGHPRGSARGSYLHCKAYGNLLRSPPQRCWLRRRTAGPPSATDACTPAATPAAEAAAPPGRRRRPAPDKAGPSPAAARGRHRGLLHVRGRDPQIRIAVARQHVIGNVRHLLVGQRIDVGLLIEARHQHVLIADIAVDAVQDGRDQIGRRARAGGRVVEQRGIGLVGAARAAGLVTAGAIAAEQRGAGLQAGGGGLAVQAAPPPVAGRAAWS